MSRICTMRHALEDPDILGSVLPGETWAAWRFVLIAACGEELTEAERAIFCDLTGREREPDEPCDEVWGVVGRRGGKTRAFAVAAAYHAACIDYEGRFAPGQRGRLPVMAAAKDQATEAFRYLLGIFSTVPMFADMVDSEPTQDTIRLSNRVDIVVTPASFRTVRGPTLVAAVCDEIAFWHLEDAANPDREILRAIRPGLMTLGGPLFVMSSRLEARLKEVLVEEKHEAFRPEFEAAEREMAQAVEAFRENYPRLAGEIAGMLSRLQKADAEAERVNITAPTTWRKTVQGTESRLRDQDAYYREHPPGPYSGGVVQVTPLSTAVRLPFLAYGDARAEHWMWVNGKSG